MNERERFQRVSEIFLRAQDLPGGEREAYLDDTCGSDAALRDEVRSLLAGPAPAGFLSSPPLGARLASESIDELLDAPEERPRRIGRYEIVDELGTGGMGIVYKARQAHPERLVALKVIRPGSASGGTARRFELEAHVLGRLQHAGIAQIFEAGTFERGNVTRHFFAMELVDGRPVDVYAREAGLDTRAKIMLVAHIADAVQHAHGKGVVHRDLKPANILVGDDGVPKILDFGVARVTDADIRTTMLETKTGRLVGTVAYMSPEQVEGDEDIDARADVYALGVLLHELLAGSRPIELSGASLAEVARRIRDDDPVPLSSFDRGLRGDVETIVLKCLEKDRRRRYQSADEFAADLRRCLDDEPISARPSTTVYQLRKFARRNRALVIGVALAFVALAAGTVATTWQAVSATRQAEKSERVRRFLESVLILADPLESGPDTTMREAVDRASSMLPADLGDHPDVAEELHETLARIYDNLAEYERALVHAESVTDIRREREGERSPDVARAIEYMAELKYRHLKYDECLSLCDQALDIQLERLGERHLDTAQTITQMGQAWFRKGDFAEAETLLRRALAIHDGLGVESIDLAESINFLGYVVKERGDFDEGLALYERALEMRRRLGGDRTQRVATSINNIGMLYLERGDVEEAERHLTDAMARRQAIFSADHPYVAHSKRNLSRVLIDTGRYDRAIDLLEGVIAAEPRPDMNIERLLLARAYLGQGRAAEAETLARDVVERWEARYDGPHPYLADGYDGLAEILIERGDLDDAEAAARRALSIRQSLLGPAHPWTLVTRSRLARIDVVRGRFEEALRAYAEIESLASGTVAETHWRRGAWLTDYARGLAAVGRRDDAEDARREAISLLEPLPPAHPLVVRAATVLDG